MLHLDHTIKSNQTPKNSCISVRQKVGTRYLKLLSFIGLIDSLYTHTHTLLSLLCVPPAHGAADNGWKMEGNYHFTRPPVPFCCFISVYGRHQRPIRMIQRFNQSGTICFIEPLTHHCGHFFSGAAPPIPPIPSRLRRLVDCALFGGSFSRPATATAYHLTASV